MELNRLFIQVVQVVAPLVAQVHPLFLLLLALLLLERGVEMGLSARNAAWSLAQGGVEAGRGHWPWMVALHTFFFVAPLVEVVFMQRVFVPALAYAMLALEAAAQVLRYWAVTSLGRHWNVRVFVVPGARAVTRGPYRYLRHPNYVAVVAEGVVVPLVHGAWLSALTFTCLNAWLLRHRIGVEQQALATVGSAYDQVGWKAHA